MAARAHDEDEDEVTETGERTDPGPRRGRAEPRSALAETRRVRQELQRVLETLATLGEPQRKQSLGNLLIYTLLTLTMGGTTLYGDSSTVEEIQGLREEFREARRVEQETNEDLDRRLVRVETTLDLQQQGIAPPPLLTPVPRPMAPPPADETP